MRAKRRCCEMRVLASTIDAVPHSLDEVTSTNADRVGT
jgi:hypothetical protein